MIKTEPQNTRNIGAKSGRADDKNTKRILSIKQKKNNNFRKEYYKNIIKKEM